MRRAVVRHWYGPRRRLLYSPVEKSSKGPRYPVVSTVVFGEPFFGTPYFLPHAGFTWYLHLLSTDASATTTPRLSSRDSGTV